MGGAAHKIPQEIEITECRCMASMKPIASIQASITYGCCPWEVWLLRFLHDLCVPTSSFNETFVRIKNETLLSIRKLIVAASPATASTTCFFCCRLSWASFGKRCWAGSSCSGNTSSTKEGSHRLSRSPSFAADPPPRDRISHRKGEDGDCAQHLLTRSTSAASLLVRQWSHALPKPEQVSIWQVSHS